MNKKQIELLATEIVDCCFQVHNFLGPGLLESAYQQSLAFELTEREISIECEKSIPVIYKGNKINCGYRIDILVEDTILLELKAVDEIHPVHKAQILTYLKLSDIKLGFLVNFNVQLITNGIKRFVNNY